MTPADEILADPDQDPSDNSWDDLLADVNTTVRTAAARKGARTAVPENLRDAPTVTPKELVSSIYKLITAERAQSAGRFRPEREEFAERKFNPVSILENWHTLGTMIRARTEDKTAPLRAWFARTVRNLTGRREDLPVNKAWSLFPGLKNAAFARLLDKALVPLGKEIVRLAKVKGLTTEEVLTLADQVGTHWHVLTEASRVFRDQIVADLESARKRLAKAGDGTEAAAEALRSVGSMETVLDVYDRYHATGEPITLTEAEAAALSARLGRTLRAGELYRPNVVGGIPDVVRRRMWKDLQEIFTEKELLHIKDLTVDGYRAVTKELLESGVLTEEDFKSWPEFAAYVALNIMKNRSALQGAYPGGYVYNPRRFDYRRHGSTEPAAGAIYNLYNAVDNAAEVIGRRDFDRELHRHYEYLKSTGNTHGLRRALLNDDESAPVGTGGRTADIMAAPGWVVRVKGEGGGRTLSYKYYFRFRDMAETEIMNKAITDTKVTSLALRGLTHANRWHGNLLTTYRLSFAPGAMVKDFIERVFNQYARDSFVRADGTTADGTGIAARMGSLAVNPEFWSAYLKSVFGKTPDTPMGRLIVEFIQSGANFTQLSLIKSLGRETSAANVKQQLMERNVLLKTYAKVRGRIAGAAPVKGFNRFFNTWNDGFNSFAPTLQYAAMRLSGMNYKDSAAETLDMMNYYKKGDWDPVGSAFFMFYRPIVQGGANMLRSLLPGGKADETAKWRGAVLFAAMTMAAMVAQGMLRSLGDDDDDGVNRYDALPFETVSRSMVIMQPGGGILKFPIGFGAPQAAFAMGSAIQRMSLGLLTPRQAASHSMVAFMKQVAPDVYPAYSAADDPFSWGLQTFVPQIFRPLVDLGVNRNYFGGEISKGSPTVGIMEYEKGRLTTAPSWHHFARTAAELTGLDYTPEKWRYLATGFLWGPLAAMTSSFEEDKLMPSKYTTAAANHAVNATGLNVFWSPEADSAKNYIYLIKERFEQDFKRTGVRVTDSEQNFTHEQRMDYIEKNMLERGYTRADVKGYALVTEFESKRRSIQDDFNGVAKKYRYGDIEVEGPVQREFQNYADQLSKLIEDTGDKLWDMDLLREGIGKRAKRIKVDQ
jgi:hypothetical protein